MRKPVIIAGAGIGGMTLGLALKLCRVPFLLLEQSKEVVAVGGGIGLWGPALMALRVLGIESKLKGESMVCAGYRTAEQIDSNSWLVRPSSSELKRLTSCLCLFRSELQQWLHKSLDPGDILLNAKVLSFEDTIGDPVRVNLENGQVIKGSMLIGADGVDSSVRSQLFPEVEPKPCGYDYWQGISSGGG